MAYSDTLKRVVLELPPTYDNITPLLGLYYLSYRIILPLSSTNRLPKSWRIPAKRYPKVLKSTL